MKVRPLCNKFRIMRTEWTHRGAAYTGPVVATDDHIYLVLKTDIGKMAIGFGIASLGIAPILLTQGLFETGLREECEVSFQDLPCPLREHAMMKVIKGDTKNFVIPKSQVTSIKVTWHNGAWVTTESFKYHLSIGFSTYKEVREFFACTGWGAGEQ